ncbi:sigma-54-dependent Fis family transcriptional regulator [Spongiibacter sp. KMU-158]|uniref:Sigma-54-dependent Fis family transcriptional regulator n=2 Tax=Spongiibacter pelagi TaxID=2760804 RepID=A0A927C1G3_9GAMM|nr:sigma-54-dependent Fis family transcriptional regulator [Spongiibacter pelagi]
MQTVDQLVNQVAGFDTLVLIRGESGSGKEVVARKIHQASNRSSRPFVPVNCGAIPADLLESELFGHEKGAFTGAIATRKGRFEMAEGGTLFLDEIGDMSLPMQVKLLRVLQERTFERVGSNEPRKCDVRILAATHRNLETMVEDGSFRQDLFFRLDVFPIEVPPLRDHVEDVPLLMGKFIAKLHSRGMKSPKYSKSAMRALQIYAWPGNVRELENLMERMAITHSGQTVTAQDLPRQYRVLDLVDDDELDEREDQDALMDALTIGRVVNGEAFAGLDHPEKSEPERILPEAGIDLKDHIQNLEKWYIEEALRREEGVITRAAQLLGLQRTTLAEKMKKLGISS